MGLQAVDKGFRQARAEITEKMRQQQSVQLESTVRLFVIASCLYSSQDSHMLTCSLETMFASSRAIVSNFRQAAMQEGPSKPSVAVD